MGLCRSNMSIVCNGLKWQQITWYSLIELSQEDAQLQRSSSVVVQIRVQLQDNLPQPEGEDKIHVNLIQYHSLAIYVPQFFVIFQYFQAFSCIAFLNGNPNGWERPPRCVAMEPDEIFRAKGICGAQALGAQQKSFFYNSIMTFFGMCWGLSCFLDQKQEPSHGVRSV